MGNLTELCKCRVINFASACVLRVQAVHSSLDLLSFAENQSAYSHLYRWWVIWYSSWPIKGLTHSSDRWQRLGPHEFVIAIIEITFGPVLHHWRRNGEPHFENRELGKFSRKWSVCQGRNRSRTPQSCGRYMVCGQCTLHSWPWSRHRLWDRGRKGSREAKQTPSILLFHRSGRVFHLFLFLNDFY